MDTRDRCEPKIGLYAFDQVITPLVEPPSSDQDEINAKIDAFDNCANKQDADCLTDITLAVGTAYEKMNLYKRVGARHTVVLVSDGEHTVTAPNDMLCKVDIIKRDNTDISLISLAAGTASGSLTFNPDAGQIPPTTNCRFYPGGDPSPGGACDGPYGTVFETALTDNCGMWFLDRVATMPYPDMNIPGGQDLTTALNHLDDLIAASCVEVIFVCRITTSCDQPIEVVIHARGDPILLALASDIKCRFNEDDAEVVDGTLVDGKGSPHGEKMVTCVAPPEPGGGRERRTARARNCGGPCARAPGRPGCPCTCGSGGCS